MIRSNIVIAAGLALVALLSAAPAQAQRDRVFVASYGSDSNPCTFGSPCKTFQQAVNVVAAGGEVTAIDSAGFGPVYIGKAVTITSPAGVEAGIAAPAYGTAITINTQGAVTLRGLTLEGAGVASNGIVFNYGTSLTISDCVVENFNGGSNTNGIQIVPSSGTINVLITNTTVLNDGAYGISYFPIAEESATLNVVIDHVIATNNNDGIYIDTYYGGGSATVAISNSVLSNNQNDGVILRNGSLGLAVSIDNTSVNANQNWGIHADGTTKVVLGRSVITSNFTNGIQNDTSPNTFYSYENNQMNLNGNSNNVGGSVPTALSFQ